VHASAGTTCAKTCMPIVVAESDAHVVWRPRALVASVAITPPPRPPRQLQHWLLADHRLREILGLSLCHSRTKRSTTTSQFHIVLGSEHHDFLATCKVFVICELVPSNARTTHHFQLETCHLHTS
jgi:hypothetical protein